MCGRDSYYYRYLIETNFWDALLVAIIDQIWYLCGLIQIFIAIVAGIQGVGEGRLPLFWVSTDVPPTWVTVVILLA